MYLLLLFLILFIAFLIFYMFLNPQFGGKLTKKQLLENSKSKHWKVNRFVNLEKTGRNFSLKTFPSFLKEQWNKTTQRKPKQPLHVMPFDIEAFNKPSAKAKFVWYGHAVLLLQVNGKNILIDPMFGSNASPIGPIQIKRFSENTLDIINDLPAIDLVLYTHDHYDHLDMDSVKRLKDKTSFFYTPLGFGRHLERWGVASNQIKEFDWWQQATFENISIHYTPSRHFSGRGLTDTAKSLWGGWVLQTGNEKIYWTGDGGYGKHFKEVNERFGGFDIAFIECGQYNENWKQIHMHPEQSVQAALDVQAEVAVPVHWAGFTLAQHSWTEPVERFVAEAQKQNLAFYTPKIGQIVSLEHLEENDLWYQKLI